jgi:hypothetical protein
MTANAKPNRLAMEKSPYLLQHAYNPVDWYPWGDEAFDKARRENKPVFLSIGYSTCHWCHVMEHESFEHEAVAKLLNEHYVSIKVDREERPDVDSLYMTVCQALTGHGGWPLTVIMTPDRKPFFAGTYFPRERKYGRAGLIDILEAVRKQWAESPEKLLEAAHSITDEIIRIARRTKQGEPSEQTLRLALEHYKETFDPKYGGFGDAPKFPAAHNLSLLLRLYRRYEDPVALEMAEKTLESMYRGGMYDHIGFGFARYSTDEKWLVPHFEKMLYDNALLATAYIEAYLVTGTELYADVAKQIFTYVLRDMTHPEGGFYSAEDADSEGVEGKFYVWTPDEVKEALGEQDGDDFCTLYGITEEGNFEGKSIPNLINPGISERWFDESPADLDDRFEACRKKLFEAREQRVHPGKDDKILTSWNGLMIAALAQGFKAFGDSSYLEAAKAAAAFIEKKLVTADGRLLARYRDGEAKYAAYVDDYACYIYGLLELYEATFHLAYLERALQLSRDMLRWYWDEADGGFYMNAHDSEQLLTRMKELYDGAMPSGNSLAAYVLQRLAHLTGDEELGRLAERQLQTFAGEVSRYPNGYSMYMQALLYAIGPSREIVISGDPQDPRTVEMIKAIRRRFLPQTVVSLYPPGEQEEAARRLMPVLAGKEPVNGQTAVYVCENFACLAPVTTLSELEQLLDHQPNAE